VTRVQAAGSSAPAGVRDSGLLAAVGIVTVVTLVGSALGLVRDLSIAGVFGANGATDAFIVAWTIPESVTPLLMEGAMAALLVPMFSHELERRGTFNDTFSALLVPVLGFLVVLTTVTAITAPVIVDALAPGLTERALGIRSVRVASLTILFLGISGYLMAALRSRQIFGWPGAVYIAYNVGILATILLYHDSLGVFSAAVGLAVGGALMVLVQLPAIAAFVCVPRPTLRLPPELMGRLAPFLPLVLYALGRHSQVFVERFAGSTLAAGTISHLNYATKVGQLPMLLAATVALVTLPALSRSAAGGREWEFRSLLTRNLRVVALVIVPVVAFFAVFAHDLIAVLFQRGAFDAGDTSDTASILRVYALGLLGQVWVVVCVEALVARPGRTWHPAKAALLGLLLTAACAAIAAPLLGASGIALANAAGISLMAVLLMLALRSSGIAIELSSLRKLLVACVLAAVGAGVIVGFARAQVPDVSTTGRVAVLAVGTTCLAVLYGAGTLLLRVPEMTSVWRLVRSWGMHRT
jgi:putative peptidoglycan lipid II flippase